MLPDQFFAKKPIIAMAHLGPLPGAPGYDAAGGIDGLIEAVAADIEALQDGGVDAVMFGNEGDRPYLLKASPESLAAMSAIVARARSDAARAVRRQLSVGPRTPPWRWRSPAAPLSRARSSPASTLPTWGCGSPMRRRAAPAREPRPARPEAAVQHQRRVRRAARRPADRAARGERGVLLAGRRDLRVGADDRRGGRPVRPREGQGRGARPRRCSPTPASTSTMSRRSWGSPTAA